jgi:hypothetical protein
MKWKVTFTLCEGASVAESDAGYPGYKELKVTFGYDVSGKLIRIEQDLDCEPELTAPDVIRRSEKILQTLWEALNFKHGAPLLVESRNARIEEPSIETGSYRSKNLAKTADAVEPIKMPKEASLLTSRLNTWLHLANQARDATEDAHALRDYCLLFEDAKPKYMHAINDKTLTMIKAARDFVSHGQIKDPEVLAFLKSKIGPIDRYNPNNKLHQVFVKYWKKEARDVTRHLINDILDGKLLPDERQSM